MCFFHFLLNVLVNVIQLFNFVVSRGRVYPVNTVWQELGAFLIKKEINSPFFILNQAMGLE